MDKKEKISLIDRIIIGLHEGKLDTVPEVLDGFQKFPLYKSEKESIYKFIEHEIVDMGIAEKTGGGANQIINGYYTFKLSKEGIKLALSKKTIADLYETKNQEFEQEKSIKELTLDNLKFQKKIQDLEEDLKHKTLLKTYWWLLTAAFGLGCAIGAFIKQIINNVW